jgi:hypothetical protein
VIANEFNELKPKNWKFAAIQRQLASKQLFCSKQKINKEGTKEGVVLFIKSVQKLYQNKALFLYEEGIQDNY